MPIENTLIAKIGGGIIAAGGATTVGVVYRNDIGNLFRNKDEESKNSYLFLVGFQTGNKDSTDQVLYKDGVKNYKCKLEENEYECDIVKKIDKNSDSTKKWINLSTAFEKVEINKNLEKSIFETANELFLLKVDVKDDSEILLNDNTKVFQVVGNVENKPKFGELKPIFGKRNNELLGQVNLFLGKIKDFGDSGESFTLPAEAGGKKYQCGFNADAKGLKDCAIYKYTDDTQTTPTSYENFKFTGKLGNKLAANSTLNKQEYYLIKFTDNLTKSDYFEKDLIYFETTTAENPATKKIINFSPILTSFLSNGADNSTDNQLLIINKEVTK